MGTPKDRDAERAYSACLQICLKQIFASFLEICICDYNHFCMLQIQLLPPIPPLEFLLKLAEALAWLRPGTSPQRCRLRPRLPEPCCIPQMLRSNSAESLLSLRYIIPPKSLFRDVGGEERLSFAAVLKGVYFSVMSGWWHFSSKTRLF